MRLTQSIKEALKKDSDPMHTVWYVVIFAAIIGFIAQYLSFASNLVLAYNDAGLHLDVARRIFDSRDPGVVNQIGVVWLPVPHLLLVPFVYFDSLWISGLAGCIPGWLYYVLISAFLYRVLRYITNDNHAALFGLAFFILNPGILYLFTTAMTEPLFLLLITIVIFHLLRWYEVENSGELIRASFAAALAVMTRYEGWTFTMAGGIIIFYLSLVLRRKHPIKSVVYFFGAPALVIIWYLWTNFALTGDVLAFQRGVYSSEFQFNLRYPEGAAFKHNFLNTLDVINNALLMNAGYIMLALSLIGLIVFIVNKKLKSDSLVPYLTLIFYPLSFYSLYLGQATIELPMTEPRGFFQSRYVISLLPGLAVFVGYFFSKIKMSNLKVTLFAMMFFFQTMWWYIVWPMGVAAIGEAETALMNSQRFKRIAFYLNQNYDGGNILYDDFSILFFSGSGIPMKERVHEYSWDIGKNVLESPSTYVKWVMLNRTNQADKISNVMLNSKDFLDHFKLIYSDEGIELYKRIF